MNKERFKGVYKHCGQSRDRMDSENRQLHVDLSAMRVPYLTDDAEKSFSTKDPIKLFNEWLTDARNTASVKEANAMALATADKSGKPSVRFVLLKGFGNEGFTFFTNYNSRKAQEIAENPHGALLFYWEALHHQVRIEGAISKTTEEESEKYFCSRPRSSQLSAAVSCQSEVIENREVLLKRKAELEQEYPDESIAIPRPKHWGGFLLVPDSFEFWTGRTDRLHDRIRFRQKISPSEVPDEKTTHSGDNGWIYEFLSP